MDETLVRMIWGVLAVVILAVIVLRRRHAEQNDEYKPDVDVVEYSLLAGFVFVAAVALLPGMTASILKIYNRIATSLATAALQ